MAAWYTRSAMQDGSDFETSSMVDTTSYFTSHSSASLLNNIIPRFVQKRGLTVRSLREVASTYVRPGFSRRTSSIASSSSISSLPSPPPPYSAEPLSDGDDDMEDEYLSAPSSRPSTSGSSTPNARSNRNSIARMDQLQDTQEDLLRYKYTAHGLALLARSARTNQQDDYERRVFLEGVAYMLRGLPQELSQNELINLKDALPRQLQDEIQEQSSEKAHSRPNTTRDLTTLSSIIAAIVYWVFLIFTIVLPYAQLAVKRACAWERKHKVGERCLHQGLALAQVTYDQVLTYVSAIWTFNDGMVGKYITKAGIWCAQEVGQGVRDGLMEATAALKRMQDAQQQPQPA
ncbi:hypothetical protein MRB53_041168 [Persea americana]|nr:hypothetical protein MRB53_041168 [Persea americana]